MGSDLVRGRSHGSSPGPFDVGERSAGIELRHRTRTTSASSSPPPGIGCCAVGSSMIPSGLTPTVIGRASLGDEYVRVRHSGLITAVAQFLYDEAALLDEWRLDEWLALFHPDAAEYLIPSPENLSEDPATTLHLVH